MALNIQRHNHAWPNRLRAAVRSTQDVSARSAPILLVELCSAERWVARIAQEVRQLLAEALLDLLGSLQEARDEGISQKRAHVPVGSGHAWRRSLS